MAFNIALGFCIRTIVRNVRSVRSVPCQVLINLDRGYGMKNDCGTAVLFRFVPFQKTERAF